MFEHNIVPWQTSLLLTESGFIDAFRQMYPDPATHPGLTWPVNNKGIPVSDLAWAAEADERDRIDYIYYYPDSRFSLVDIKMERSSGANAWLPIRRSPLSIRPASIGRATTGDC